MPEHIIPDKDACFQIFDENFAQVIGQPNAKARLRNVFACCSTQKGYLQNMLITAPLGTGKTLFLKQLTKTAKAILGRKIIKVETGKDLGSVTDFFTEILIGQMENTPSILIVDEAHEAKTAIFEKLRDCIQPSVSKETQEVRLGAETFTWNPMLNTVILSTNAVDKMLKSLVSRFGQRIDLQIYSDKQMLDILKIYFKNIDLSFEGESMEMMAECLRGTARDAVHWIDSLKGIMSIKDKTLVTEEDVFELITERESLPLGVTRRELQTLLFLEEFGPLQLQELAHRNQCAPNEQKSYEAYLFQKGFIQVEGKRTLTGKGVNYLKSLRAKKLI